MLIIADSDPRNCVIITPMPANALDRLKNRTHQLRRDTLALYFAYRDPRTPGYARLFAAYVVIRTFSPIDLIPDFIPVLGQLDDLILTPLGIILALKMIPAPVMDTARQQADQVTQVQPPGYGLYVVLVILIWVLAVLVIGLTIWKLVQTSA